MTNVIKIPVYMPEEEAKKFLLFQQYYDEFSLLAKSKVFEQSNCTVLIDFDKFGKIGSIRRQDFLYSSRQ